VVRVAADGTVLDAAPALVRAGFERNSRIDALGGRWLVVWESQVRHDNSASRTRGAFVDADGVPGSPFIFDGSFSEDDPDLALSGDGSEVLVVWSDSGGTDGLRIEGRRLAADGTFLGPVFDVADPPGSRFGPAVAWDGDGWTVGWTELRRLVNPLDEARGDVYAGRVAADGTALDPDGVPVATELLGEKQPELLPSPGLAGGATIAYTGLPTPPETYRIVLRGLGTAAAGTGGLFADDFESGDTSAWSAAVP
jgi:hypothetical protein